MNTLTQKAFSLNFLKFLPFFLGRLKDNLTEGNLEYIGETLQDILDKEFEINTILNFYSYFVKQVQDKNILMPLGLVQDEIPSDSIDLDNLLENEYNFKNLSNLTIVAMACFDTMDIGVDTKGLFDNFVIPNE